MTVDRGEAIARIVRETLSRLDPWEREAHVRSAWYCRSETDEELEEEARESGVPRHLLEQIRRPEESPDDVSDPRYDPLVERSLRWRIENSTNEYLSGRIGCMVTGPEPELLPCPCCGYCTLRERGVFETCHVCWWEDELEGGNDSIPFCPNRVALDDARRNFDRFGASDPRYVDRVDPEDRQRYRQGWRGDS